MFQIVQAALDPRVLKSELARDTCGACVTFEGWVRDNNNGRKVAQLEYEVHRELATKEGERVIAEASKQFEIELARCRHREGLLKIGECSVWVGVSAPHRDAAFAACRYIIDEIKQRLPIWKKEYYKDGDSGWVNCEHCTPRRSGEPDIAVSRQEC